MAVRDQVVTDDYLIAWGDCMEVMKDLPDKSIHLSIYSPPFGGLFSYSSDLRDFSNCTDYEEFFEMYDYCVREVARLTMPGRISCVHCADVINKNANPPSLTDFPGDIIRQHKRFGFHYIARYHIWKEPLGVRNQTMLKSLAHRTIVEDSSKCSCANADYLLVFRKTGDNPIPIEHLTGLQEYAGSREIPYELLQYKGYEGNQIENKYSHWIWRNYASAFWDDIRLKEVLPYREAREDGDESHIHPLQLDVIDRALVLWSNPGEKVLTPFMGVGSEVYAAVRAGRLGIGAELKETYYRQAVLNVADAKKKREEAQLPLIAGMEIEAQK